MGGKCGEREVVGLWGEIFREVREDIGLVFGCEEEGGRVEREREGVVGLWGRFLGK